MFEIKFIYWFFYIFSTISLGYEYRNIVVTTSKRPNLYRLEWFKHFFRIIRLSALIVSLVGIAVTNSILWAFWALVLFLVYRKKMFQFFFDREVSNLAPDFIHLVRREIKTEGKELSEEKIQEISKKRAQAFVMRIRKG